METVLLHFNNVLPQPLADYPHEPDSVWKNEFELTFPNKILLNASSGKGKTTFSNILYGLRRDYSGQIELNGKNIAQFSLNDWVNLRRTSLSAIFQDLQLFPKLTAWENLLLKNKLTDHKTEDEIYELLSRLGLGDKKEQLCGTLSLGQQQRIAIIRALLQPFQLLIMDEPFSHLDEGNTHIALELINEETDKNKAGYILTTLGSRHGFMYDLELSL